MTKAMTGLVIADAVRRGEIRMDAPVSTYLPQLKGSPAGTVTMQRARHPHRRLRRVRGRDPAQRRLESTAGAGLPHRRQRTDDQGNPRADAGRPRPLRLLHPGLSHRRAGRRGGRPPELPGPDAHPTLRAARHVAHRHRGRPPTRGGRQRRRPVSRSSRGSWTPTHPARPPSPPPATSRNSPPPSSTGPHPAWPPWSPPRQPTSRTPASAASGRSPPGRTARRSPAHAGQTGGYASYLGIDRARHKAVIVLSDVANNANDLGIELLIDRG